MKRLDNVCLRMSSLLERIDRELIIIAKRGMHVVRPYRGDHSTRVFVAGMQRSGTNMMMDILERSLETDVYHERDPRAFRNYQMRERVVISALAESCRARYFVIKALCELQDLTSLLAHYEPAKVLWIVRHYEDVVNSMLFSFRNMAKQVQRIAVDRSSSGWLGHGMSNETHNLIKRLVRPNIDDATASALQWYFRNVLFFEQRFDSDERVLLVSYERLVVDPWSEFQRIFEFLGLASNRHCIRYVTPRYVHRRSPPSLDEPVRKVCERLMTRFETMLEARA
jgi:hypothetical protein